MRILCSGDLHIGRRPSRTPASIDSARYSCAAAWTRLVDYAIANNIDVLLLAGDIVDRGDRFFEAFGAFERGLARLARAGIDSIAVAGNHDFDTLPRLVDTAKPERFALLGRGGQWESRVVRRGDEQVRIDGWSFPTQYVMGNPLRSYNLAPPDGATIGLLHADLDVPGSKYAPITTTDLNNSSVTSWVLGHIHRPGAISLSGGGNAFYCGSLQGLDPGEPGPHGAWTIDAAASPRPVHRHLAPLRYDELPVDLTGIDSELDFQDRATVAIRKHVESCAATALVPLEALLCRVVAGGRVEHIGGLEKFGAALEEAPGTQHDQTLICIESVNFDAVQLDHNLEELARGSNPPAVLARALRGLTNNEIDAPLRALIDETVHYLQSVNTMKCFQPLPATTLDEVAARTVLLREGYRMLDQLLSQKGGA